LHFRFITELQKYNFNPPTQLKNLDEELRNLAKYGILSIESLFHISKLISYFSYLKSFKFDGIVKEWLTQISIPQEIVHLPAVFSKDGIFSDSADEKLYEISRQIEKCKKEIATELAKVIHTEKVQPYLVDRQVHLINDEESLLLRSGFSLVLKARIVSRSASGFFYVVPASTSQLRSRYDDLVTHKAEVEYALCKKLSTELGKLLPFLKFLNSAFDRFDKYQARVFFARRHDTIFLEPKNSSKIVLKEFHHPAIKTAQSKAFNIDFSKKILIITGVNAGGKTMLLKSIMSAAFLAKYLMPMRIHEQSHIGSFSKFTAIIDDPQSVKHDISTFAGRIRQFSSVLKSESSLLGVDEIELGTDSEEASALFKSLLARLSEQGHKIIITTHHKKLAILMSSNEHVELTAAMYDEKSEKPTYEFLPGLIGKSYAFETAMKYGIPRNIIEEAKITYGEDKQKISDLVEQSSKIQNELKEKTAEAAKEAERLRHARHSLEATKEELQKEFDKLKLSLELEYKKAIDLAKNAAKSKEQKEIHRALNEAHKISTAIGKSAPANQPDNSIKPGDAVRYGTTECRVLQMDEKKILLDADGKKFWVDKAIFFQRAKKINLIKGQDNKPKNTKVSVEKPNGCSVTLDLHGLRVEEALELTGKYISDAILAGLSEAYIYHGIGSGRLAGAVKEFLKTHPSVEKFTDAPANQGGYGATIVYF